MVLIQDANFEQVVQGYVDEGFTFWIERDGYGWDLTMYNEKSGLRGTSKGKTVYAALIDAIYNLDEE